MKPSPSTSLATILAGVLLLGAGVCGASDLEQVLDAHAARASRVSTARIEWSALRTDGAGSYDPGHMDCEKTTPATEQPPGPVALRDGGSLLKRGSAWRLDRRQELWNISENAVHVSNTSCAYDGLGEGRMLDRDRNAGFVADSNPALDDVVLTGYELALRPDALDPASPTNAFRSSRIALARTEEIDGVPCAVLVAGEGPVSTEIAVRPDGAPVRFTSTNDQIALRIVVDFAYANANSIVPDRTRIRGRAAGRTFEVDVTTERVVFGGEIPDASFWLEFPDGAEVLDRRTNRKTTVGIVPKGS